MSTLIRCALVLVAAVMTTVVNAEEPKFKALALYNTNVEKAHQKFAKDAVEFYSALAAKDNFVFDTTTDWSKLNTENLKNYDVVLWLNDSAHGEEQKIAFQRYMENGGGWLGFHVSGYNDKNTKWPWFVQFMGDAVFNNNNWPVGPDKVKVTVDTTDHPATKRMPKSYDSPPNEFYQWVPSPRLNESVKVLMTLDPSNYPLGKKNVLPGGDTPIAWTNTRYRMVYTVLGHGDDSGVFSSPDANKFFEDALLWVGESGKK
jgi:hypothetical protein